jgi:heat shock protein HslJ
VRLAVAPLVLAIVGALVAGCGGDDEGGETISLEGVSWVLASGIDVDGWEDAPPNATFEEGRLTGSTGCNRYSGQYRAGEDTLTIDAVASTLMACPPPADEVERTFVAAIERVAGWRIEGDELVLVDPEDDELLRFAAATPAGSWVATGFLRDDVFRTLVPGSEITLVLGDDGEVSGSAGCNTYTATYESDAGTIEITAPAATRMSCSSPAGVMEQEGAYLGALPTATGYRLDGSSLQLLRADGTGLASYTRAP